MEPLLGEKIRDILSNHAKLAVGVKEINDDDNLYAAGMTSHASVNVMLALEDAFDIEFPESSLTKAAFSSVRNISQSLAEIALD